MDVLQLRLQAASLRQSAWCLCWEMMLPLRVSAWDICRYLETHIVWAL